MDIARGATASSVSGGRIQQIDVQLAPGVEVGARPPAWPSVWGPACSRHAGAAGTTGTSLLSAFRLNLTALSLISLFVGLFSSTRPLRPPCSAAAASSGFCARSARRADSPRPDPGRGAPPRHRRDGGRNPHRLLDGPPECLRGQLHVDELYLLQAISSCNCRGGSSSSRRGVGIGAAPRRRHRTASTRLAGTLGPPVPLRCTRGFACSRAGWASRCGDPSRSSGMVPVLRRQGKWGGFLLGVALLLGLPLLTPLLVQMVCGRIRPVRFDLWYSLKSLSARLHATRSRSPRSASP